MRERILPVLPNTEKAYLGIYCIWHTRTSSNDGVIMVILVGEILS